MDNTIICTTKETLIDIKKARLTYLMLTRLEFTHAIVDKAQAEDHNVQNMDQKVKLLEQQVKYYRADQGTIIGFI